MLVKVSYGQVFDQVTNLIVIRRYLQLNMTWYNTCIVRINIFQTFGKWEILWIIMIATWPKWLWDNTEVAARIIKWMWDLPVNPGCRPLGQSGCENHKMAKIMTATFPFSEGVIFSSQLISHLVSYQPFIIWNKSPWNKTWRMPWNMILITSLPQWEAVQKFGKVWTAGTQHHWKRKKMSSNGLENKHES